MPRFDITIAGEANLDLILYGLPDELPPERELLADRMMVTLGGSSAILAHNLSALGSRVGFQSRIGDDDLGQSALLTLQQTGVDVSRVRRVPGPVKTGLTVVLQREAWRNMVTYSGTIAELTWNDLDLDYLADARLPSVFFLLAARVAATRSRIVPQNEGGGADHVARHQRRSRRRMGRWPG